MHQQCFNNYCKRNIACPLCRKSIFDIKFLEAHLDNEIAMTPMPDEYKNKYVNIMCNDCLKKSMVKFHIVGHKCKYCRSYNTQVGVGGIVEMEQEEVDAEEEEEKEEEKKEEE
jgi:RING finger/CHY zinc finger protein 1